MDLWSQNFLKKSRRKEDVLQHHRAIPKRLFNSLASNREIYVNNCVNSTNDWVSARFTSSDDNLLCLGGNDGSVGLYKVECAIEENATDLDQGMISCLKAHSGAVMGVYGVPGRSNELLSIGGDGTAKIFDMETKNRLACFNGHETIVRSASFNPENSNEFVTCGRDGKICKYDRRCQAKRDKYGINFIPAIQTVLDAHNFTNGTSKDFTYVHGLTNIIYLDEYTILTSSDKALSGIRMWDPRKLVKVPFDQLMLPQRKESKQIGVASMDINRYSSSLFVAVTDNNIYEFPLGFIHRSPVRKFTQSCTSSYDVVIAASPVSDHLLSGSLKTDGAYLYKVPDKYFLDAGITDQLEEIKPTYKLEGHIDSDVTACSWSCNGKYIVTLDENRFRIWSPNFECDAKENLVSSKDNLPAFNRIKFVGDQYEKSFSVRQFSNLTVSPMKSPFKSPVKKRMRMGSHSSPLSDISNSHESPGRKRFRIFCTKYLTKNLPQRSNNDYESESIEVQHIDLPMEKKKAQRSLIDFFSKKDTIANSSEEALQSDQRPITPDSSKKLTTKRSSYTLKRYFTPSPHNRRLK